MFLKKIRREVEEARTAAENRINRMRHAFTYTGPRYKIIQNLVGFNLYKAETHFDNLPIYSGAPQTRGNAEDRIDYYNRLGRKYPEVNWRHMHFGSEETCVRVMKLDSDPEAAEAWYSNDGTPLKVRGE